MDEIKRSKSHIYKQASGYDMRKKVVADAFFPQRFSSNFFQDKKITVAIAIAHRRQHVVVGSQRR